MKMIRSKHFNFSCCISLKWMLLFCSLMIFWIDSNSVEAFPITEGSHKQCFPVAEILVHDSNRQLVWVHRLQRPVVAAHWKPASDNTNWIVFYHHVGSERFLQFAHQLKNSGKCRFLTTKVNSISGEAKIRFTSEMPCRPVRNDRAIDFNYKMDILTNKFYITSKTVRSTKRKGGI